MHDMSTSLLWRLSIMLMIFCVLSPLAAQESTLGIPETVNYSKDLYGGGTQNWAITQDASGLMLFGNNKGVLVFDGTNWQVIPLPNRTIVRSLAQGPDGRIYVGGQDEFGFLTKDECQRICYESLSNRLAADNQSFEDVWKIFVADNQVFFCTQEALFIWDGSSFAVTPADQRFENFFWLNGQLYAQERGKGLLRWQGEQLKLVPDGERFENTRIAAILPLGASPLIVTDFSGLYRITPSGTELWDVEASAFLKQHQAYCGLSLPDGNMAIGTAQNGLLVIGAGGEIVQHLNKRSGLQNNTILSIYQDRLNNFWLATDNGIDYVKISTPFSLIQDYLGIDGTGYAATVDDGRLYLGTNQGLFYLDWPVQQDALNLSKIKEVTALSGQIWGFSPLGENLMINSHSGLYELADGQVSPVSTIEGSWKIVPLPQQPGLAVEGGYTGLYLYTRNATTGRWEYSHKIAGFEESARVLEVDEQGYIWVSHAYKGLFRLKLVDNNQRVEVHFYGPDQGLPSRIALNVLKIKNGLVATSSKGAYRYNQASDYFEPFIDLNAELGGPGPISRLLEDADGRLWFSKGAEFGYFEIQESGFLQEPTVRKVFFNHLQEHLVDGFEHVYPIDTNNLIIATEDGFISYHPQRGAGRDLRLDVLIREVSLSNTQDSVIYSEGLVSLDPNEVESSYRLPKTMNALSFGFAAPFYEQIEDLQYRHRLRGYQEEWSRWSFRHDKEFTNLPAGDYIFEVEAQNSYGAVSPVRQFSFTVLPPWYASLWAKIVYFLLGSALIAAFFVHSSRRLREQRNKLEAEQAETLAQKEAEFQEEKVKSAQAIDRLENEKLEADVQHKTSQLASATMHLVHKGEVLLKIKKELSKILKGETTEENRRKLQRIIHTIDGDARLDSNWEQFEIYFDQVHKNFLRNLRQSFPDLTPKDQKLCAYLRMNLTTKEIAPLMNISVRGVEISRYRLRKKLHLDTNTNLTDFIMRF